ncbi:MAG TPA: tetratricopeptide repeat protein [Vicinamibacterales bacterium]|nr:tetratricopeptide repeat protein [Vicinamibacterales bacterium]
MADFSRIEDLRRRVQRDPASIAFAQLAEEYRRNAQYAEAVETCRGGLALHPGYLSARVTLGRALLELGRLEEAQEELELVLRSAPENLAAIRGVAEIHQRGGDLPKALEYFKSALALARNDPDLEETVNDLTRELGHTRRGPDTGDGLTLDQIQGIFAAHVPPAPSTPAPRPVEVPAPTPEPITPHVEAAIEHLEAVATEHLESAVDVEHPKDLLTIEHLEAFLTGVYAIRAERRA